MTSAKQERVQQQDGSPVITRTVGDRLMKARKMAGLNITQLREKTGMARNSIPDYESDETTIRTHHAMAYAMATHEAFGKEPYEVADWLLYGDTPADVGPNGEPFDPSRMPVSRSRWNTACAIVPVPLHLLRPVA